MRVFYSSNSFDQDENFLLKSTHDLIIRVWVSLKPTRMTRPDHDTTARHDSEKLSQRYFFLVQAKILAEGSSTFWKL